MLGALGKAAGWVGQNLLGPALGWAGEKDRRGFDAEQAAVNRSFQERMRNTEWQAAVADMELAGVNPAMALQRGGASSPGGSMPGSAQNAGSSALQFKLGQQQLALTREQIRKTSGEADSAQAAGRLAKDRTAFLMQDISEPGKYTVAAGHRKLLESEVGRAVAEAARAGSMARVAGVGGQVADAFGEVMPGFGRVMRVAGQGASQMAGVVEVMEKAARMRDSAVQAWLGVPKAAVMRLRDALRKAKR